MKFQIAIDISCYSDKIIMRAIEISEEVRVESYSQRFERLDGW